MGADRCLLKALIITLMEPHTTRLRVRYAETDQMGVVHHKNYYVWMEVARTELCEALGFRYLDMERDYGVLLAVIESSCRYIAAVRFDDEVSIKTWLAEVNSRTARFCYEMSVGERLVASGETRHIFLNRDLRPTRLPAEFRPFFGLPNQT